MSYPPNQSDPQGPGHSQPQPDQPYGGQAPQHPGGYGPPDANPPGAPNYGAPSYGAPGYGAPGQPPAAPGQAPMAPGYGAPGEYGGGYGQAAVVRRPGTVTAGAILTWVGCGLMMILGLILAVAGGSLGLSEAFGEMTGAATGIMVGVGVFVVIAGLIPLLLSIFAFRGSKGSLIGLTVVGALWVLLLLFSLVNSDNPGGGIVSILWIGGATALFWAGRAWYDARRRA